MTAAKIKKKISLAAIKKGELVGAPVPVTIDIVVNGEECEIDAFIKPASYDTAIKRYQAYGENKEALAGIIATRVVNAKGKPEFTEDQVREYFNDALTEAVFAKITEVDHPPAGKDSAMEMTNSGTSLSSTELVDDPLPKPSAESVMPSSSNGGNTEPSAEALTQAGE